MNQNTNSPLSRRRFLLGAGGLAGLFVVGQGAGNTQISKTTFASDPFTLGVASGEPASDGMVLWTRLALDPLNGGGMPNAGIPVSWRLATDENLQQVVRSGIALATPALAHSVHVELGGLEPGRPYWYQFSAGGRLSPIGRTRTAPAANAPTDRLRFAFASCSDWQNGYFAAYGAMAQEDLDVVVYLGDYIYEYDPRSTVPGRLHTPSSAGPQPDQLTTLSDYRNRHAQYKTDRNLQAAHAAFPWIVTWDDHETENNYADEIDEIEGNGNTSPAAEFRSQRAAAYQAYYEHMPLRRSALPVGPDLQLYRRLAWGDLAVFNVLDTRQYRTDQPCGDGFRPQCEGAFDPNATLLGSEQEQWLYNGLATSSARWNVLAQQVMMAQFDFNPLPSTDSFNVDQWDGYVASRNRLFAFLQASQTLNPVVLTGDIHSSWVHDLKADFNNPASPTLGTELVCTSITASFPPAALAGVAAAAAITPHTRYFDGANRGYVRCELDRDVWRTDFRIVPTAPTSQVLVQEAPASTRASFVIENGRPGAVPA